MLDTATVNADAPLGVRRPLVVLLGVLAGLSVGSALIAYSFHLGASGGDGSAMFACFWAGALAATIPLVLVGTSSRAASWQRVLAVAGIAAVTTLPKILRSPSGPLFHDEYAHLKAVTDILVHGAPDGFNSLVLPAPYFPGLHYLTAWIAEATHLSAWQSGLLIVSIVHVVGLIGVYALARAVGVTSRGAAVAAVVYATNANWMFFHSQFSYESLGLPLMLVTLAIAVAVIRNSRTGRWWIVLFLGAAGYLVAAVHHLSSLGMLAVMFAMTLSTTFLSRSRAVTVAMWAALAAMTAGVAVRLVSVSTLLLDYLGSPVNRGVTQLQDIVNEVLGTNSDTAQAHTLFDNSLTPVYERLAGFAVAPILAAAVLAYAVIWFQQRRSDRPRYRIVPGSPMRAGLAWFGVLYFVSLPLMFAPAANEGGRRSWGYTMIGVAVIVAMLIDALSTGRATPRPAETDEQFWLRKLREEHEEPSTDVPSAGVDGRDGERGRDPGDLAGRLPRSTAVVAVLAWVVLLIGGVATGVNVLYRFPLPASGVSDLTAASTETKALGDWFAQNVPPNTWVLTDRYSSMTVAGRGGMRVTASSGRAFPYYQLYYSMETPPLKLMAEIWALNAQYLVVDRRMATQIPSNGWWLGPDDPRPAEGEPFASEEALAKFDYMPWADEVYASENYVVYRLDLTRYNPYQTQALLEEHRS